MKNLDLLTNSYNYELPVELIAQAPCDRRDHSKLLIFDEASGAVTHTRFDQLADFLERETCLALNNTKVFSSRVFAQKSTGSKAEFLFLDNKLDQNKTVEVMIKSNGKKKIRDTYFLPGNEFIQIVSRGELTFKVVLGNITDLASFLKKYAQIPIPPYIRNGESDESDLVRYQTTFAKEEGSIAAPTAGLHFTDSVFESLEEKNIQKSFVTLHVGIGTFRPVFEEQILNHKMHSEIFKIESAEFDKLQNKKTIAVGTTTLRVLESMKTNSKYRLDEYNSTDIFLYPGKEVTSIHGLLTNFHLPKSTLLMLVSSLIGREKTLELYEEAIKHKYRFYSYGDAMLILRKGYR